MEKPLDAYYRDNRYPDSPPRPACKDCINRRQKTPKKPRRAVPKACSKCGVMKPPLEFGNEPRHADGLRAECKDCFNSDERYQKSLAYRRSNPERVREYNRRAIPNRAQYDRAHPEQRQAIGARRRAKKAGNGPNDLTTAQWKAIKAAYGNRCAYCGLPLLRLTMDHVVPIANGGAHTAANIVPACKPCNQRKNTKPAPTHQPHMSDLL